MMKPKNKRIMEVDIAIIGAGLTGLTTGFHLVQRNKKIIVLEQAGRVGGQIHSFQKDGFVFESGPNTGVISYPEVAELFQDLGNRCVLQTAHEEAKKRLIWKGNRFHALPSGLASAIATPLFSWYDKFRILGEPFRAKGTNPDESVGELAARRLGKSFVNYAVDPFLSGVYAGDPMKLTTRYALPKLYNLEQTYGSFIKGSIAKAKLQKTNRDKLATKQVFSVQGGLENLVRALADAIDHEQIVLNAQGIKVVPMADGKWQINYMSPEGERIVHAKKVVTTTGAYTLPSLLPFVDKEDMQKISSLYYAPVIQVSVGVKEVDKDKYRAFGGLVPSCEKRNVLGILYPSACFDGRSPVNGALFSFFIGGVRHPEMLEKTDDEIKELVRNNFHQMLKFADQVQPDLIEIFRHKTAIPQYRADSGERLATIDKLQQKYPGLIIAGNLRDGIGMADRIRQGTTIGSSI